MNGQKAQAPHAGGVIYDGNCGGVGALAGSVVGLSGAVSGAVSSALRPECEKQRDGPRMVIGRSLINLGLQEKLDEAIAILVQNI